MENKYFTPDIEDFHVGYEYERFVPRANATEEECWEKLIMSVNYLSLDDIDNEIIEKEIRVPYLTKEQIEAEGWTYKTKSTDLWFERKEIFLREDGYHLENIKLQYGLHDYRLKISFVYVGDSEESTNAYLGECKDINTFRLIQKLLGIK